MRLVWLIAPLALAACVSPGDPKVRTVEVQVPITRACVPADTPPAPAAYPDQGAKDPAVSPHDRYQRIAAANAARDARLAIVEPIIAGCR